MLIVCHVLEILWRATEIALGDAVETRPFEGVYDAFLLVPDTANPTVSVYITCVW